jgi:hypothetical protein
MYSTNIGNYKGGERVVIYLLIYNWVHYFIKGNILGKWDNNIGKGSYYNNTGNRVFIYVLRYKWGYVIRKWGIGIKVRDITMKRIIPHKKKGKKLREGGNTNDIYIYIYI